MTQGKESKQLDIDTSTEFGERVARQLREEEIVWLTTVGADKTPQPSPVWFYWDGETAIIYSQPQAPKVGNIRRGLRVSLSFNTTEEGEGVVILIGDAWIDKEAPAANRNEAYIEKYREGLKSLPQSLDEISQEYSTVVRVRPTRLRGF